MLNSKEHSDFLDECLKNNFDTDRVKTYLDPFGFMDQSPLKSNYLPENLKTDDERPITSIGTEPLQNKMM